MMPLKRQWTGGTHRSVTPLLTCLALALLAGCAPLSESARDARDYRRIDYQEEFRYFARRCAARGDKVVIQAQQKLGRNGLPRPGDRYFCV